MGNLTISIAIFKSYLDFYDDFSLKKKDLSKNYVSHYQRVSH